MMSEENKPIGLFRGEYPRAKLLGSITSYPEGKPKPMSIHDRDATGQPAYFPGFSSTSTSAEPFFVEIEESSKPSPDAGQRPAWLPSPKKAVQSEAPKKPVPPVPNRSAKPQSLPAHGGKRALVVNTQPEEDLPWQEQVVRWIQGEGGAGFGISVLVHVVLLLVLSLLVLATPRQEDLITTLEESPEADVAAIQDVEIVEPIEDFVPQVKNPEFDPAPLSAPDIGIGTIASSLLDKPGGGLDIQIPKQAVTKGSFTVWTVPEDPAPGQQYVIMIRVKLNDRVKRYPRSDMAGNILGTDGYKNYFGGPTEPGYLPINENSVQVQACIVPGASQLVKDVITVESKILKEKQVIEIVF